MSLRMTMPLIVLTPWVNASSRGASNGALSRSAAEKSMAEPMAVRSWKDCGAAAILAPSSLRHAF
jgi:hypothetical protein